MLGKHIKASPAGSGPLVNKLVNNSCAKVMLRFNVREGVRPASSMEET